MAISRRNAVHALIFMVISLIAVAVVFYTLGAPYAAVLEIIVYAGAIMILFVFTVMMLNMSVSPEDEKRATGLKSWILPVSLSIILLGVLVTAFSKNSETAQLIKTVGPKEVGISLFTTYVLVAELAGILLLAAIVGAYHLGRTNKKELHRYLSK